MAKIAIITTFQEFNPGYSLTGIVKDQARMLTEHGHDVTVFVRTTYHGGKIPGITLSNVIPHTDQIDYRSKEDLTDDHRKLIRHAAKVLARVLADYDCAFTHDIVFTGWSLPYAIACIEATPKLPNLRWLHWIHSIPSGDHDWWRIENYGENHHLVYPNESDRLRVAEHFCGRLEDIRVVPHIKDLRIMFDFSKEACEFIAEHPRFMKADILQVYPCSTDRLSAKRLDMLIWLFGKFKQIGFSVCLVAANQWATTKRRTEDLLEYEAMATAAGLVVGEDFIFTSQWRHPQYETGISQRFLRELTQCTNLFVFPTREESFGLVLPEAALTGGCLCVVNKSLTCQLEISGYNTLALEFGAYDHIYQPNDFDKYVQDMAFIIAGRMREDDSIRLKTWMRQRYNYDFLYHRYYGPIMREIIN